MGFLFRLCLFILIIGLPVTAGIMSIQKEALVARPGEINLADFHRAQRLAERYDPRRMAPERITTVQTSSLELNTLLKGAFSGLKQVATRVETSRFGVIAAVTAELPVPANPLGRYINIRTVIAPSQDGLDISRFAIGSLEIPPAIIKPVLLYGLNHLVGDGKGQPILDSIRSVRVAGPAITVAFKPPPGLVADLKKAAKRHASVSDPDTVGRYYEKIENVMSSLPRRGRVSLMEVIRPVFQMAQSRSRKFNPVRENEAALLALAMYFGDLRFERFVGQVLSDEQKSRRRKAGHFGLNGRYDFVQHFTISVGLTLTGGDLAANIIGELKEAKDSQRSSGFSFTDIGADRAGVKLAKLATSGEEAALRVQQVLANSQREEAFFPGFTDLPEGLSEAAFRQRYGDVNSREYKRIIAEIDKRIYRTRLYQ